MASLETDVLNCFGERFNGDPIFVRSPGRVNLIGEHTDYNDGFVLPAAIDRAIWLAIAANGSDLVNLQAIDLEDTFSHDLADPVERSGQGWPDYVLGVIRELQREGHRIGGFDCVFGGDIPIGAGLSSSAALEDAALFGLSHLFDLELSRKEMALMAQRSENNFVGVRCGIMDQFVNLHGETGHALKLDCRSLEYELFPFPQEEVRIVLCDTKITHDLASTEYNVRREQCEEGVELLAQYDDSVRSLRDATLALLEKHRGEMDPVIYNRCRFVVEENGRVEAACRDLERGDIGAFGRRMEASHAGLRDLYEVSCEELDILAEEAAEIDGVLGARMMGGGFGGCTINLVGKDAAGDFSDAIRSRYSERTGKEIEIYRTRIGGGVELIPAKS